LPVIMINYRQKHKTVSSIMHIKLEIVYCSKQAAARRLALATLSGTQL